MHLHIVFYYLLFSIVNIHIAHANVEKTIFLAPQASTIPSEESDLDDLGLERLSPDTPVVRTQLNASFPTDDASSGTESWFFLENLNPGQRYEVRVCWLATVSDNYPDEHCSPSYAYDMPNLKGSNNTPEPDIGTQ